MQPIRGAATEDAVYNAASGIVNGINAGSTSAAGGIQTVVIPVNLNGRKIAEVIYDPLKQVGKQRGY